MKDTMKWLLYSPLIILHICCFYCSSNKMIIKADIDRWKLFRPHLQERSTLYALMYLLIFQPSFRNQYYLRMGTVRALLKLLLHEVPCSVLETRDIGGGFVLMHGMGTSINGLSRIGSNCTIYHNVLIGVGKDLHHAPIIGDDVTIGYGAILLGDIRIGNRVRIGAGTVVTQDIPDDTTVVGQKPRMICHTR